MSLPVLTSALVERRYRSSLPLSIIVLRMDLRAVNFPPEEVINIWLQTLFQIKNEIFFSAYFRSCSFHGGEPQLIRPRAAHG